MKRLAATVGCVLVVAAAVVSSAGGDALRRDGTLGGFVPPPSSLAAAPFPVCPALAVIGSRGSGERAGDKDWAEGLGPPADAVAKAVAATAPGTQYTYNLYQAIPVLPSSLKTAVPDLLNGVGAKLRKYWLGAYHASETKGETLLRAMVKAQIAQCGFKTSLLLVGYSQGAQATGNVYAGLSAAERTHISGVALFGDPLFNKRSFAAVDPNLDHNGIIGTRGEFPADAKGHVRSYCHPRDPVCQGWTQLVHWDTAHKTYAGPYEPLDAATRLAPFPLPRVSPSVCEARGQPLVDVTFKYVRTTDTTSLNSGPRYWAYDSGHQRWEVWQLGGDAYCLVRIDHGGFTSVAGSSPNGRAAIPAGISGHFEGTDVSTFTGTYAPQRPTRGDVGVLNYDCSITNNGEGDQCAKVSAFGLFFSNWSATSAKAADWRYWSLNGSAWWQTDRVYLGDITR